VTEAVEVVVGADVAVVEGTVDVELVVSGVVVLDDVVVARRPCLIW